MKSASVMGADVWMLRVSTVRISICSNIHMRRVVLMAIQPNIIATCLVNHDLVSK